MHVRPWLFALLLLPLSSAAQSPVERPRKPGGPQLDVDFEATAPVVARAMLDLAAVDATDVVMDLGCGEGDIALAAVRAKRARAICVELDPERIAKAKANAHRQGLSAAVTFVEGDLFKVDLAPASVITLFLWDTLNLRLRPKLLQLKPGTRIVSHAHDMADWRPDRQELHNHRSSDGPSAIYLWIVPANIEGRWILDVGGERHQVAVAQRFQHFTATGAKVRLRNGRVIGDVALFELVDARGTVTALAGRIEASTITSSEALQVPARLGVSLQGRRTAFRMTRTTSAP